jgi:hypothetical protein
LRDIEYDEGLRIDKINGTVEVLATTLKNNAQLKEGEVNSIIQLLGVKPASAPTIEVSKDTSLVLEAINNLGQRLSRLETKANQSPLERSLDTWRLGGQAALGKRSFVNEKGEVIIEGDTVSYPGLGNGVVAAIDKSTVGVSFEHGRIASFPIGPGLPAGDLELVKEK